MPTISIDTFFACALLVSVAIIATAFMAGTMQTQINSMQDINKQDYLQNIANHIVSSYGSPENWGSSGAVPVDFGLSSTNSQSLCKLDTDKVTRLNSQNVYALSFLQVFAATRLDNIAFGISVSQFLQIEVTLSSDVIKGNLTDYTFQIAVNQNSEPVNANLHCYIVAPGFVNDTFVNTSSQGVGSVTFELQNSANGPAALVVFARATFDDRLTSYDVYPFAHLSANPEPNQTFLILSPFNQTLTVTSNYSNITIGKLYAFTFLYQSNLTLTSNNTYAIPSFTDKSPIVLLAQGTNDTTQFNEWTAYPQVPLDFGTDFSNSEANLFVYPVTINGVLYKLTLSFGDLTK